MALTKTEADKITATLKSEFNDSATVLTKGQLDGSFKVIVDTSLGYSRKGAPDDTLRAIEARANEVAGRKLDRNALEFKSGFKHF